jgi:hypothetical protein
MHMLLKPPHELEQPRQDDGSTYVSWVEEADRLSNSSGRLSSSTV